MQTPYWERSRDREGNFISGDKPPRRKVTVCLSDPFIKKLDAYGKAFGVGRGGAIEELLELNEPEVLAPAKKNLVRLEAVKRSDPIYKDIRSRHYIPDKGCVGMQLHYLVFYGNEVAGCIGGASSVFRNEDRDIYFGISSNKEIRTSQLNSIVNNHVFRLELNLPNLASIVLAKWRRQVIEDWKSLYGIEVAGFETFVVPSSTWNGNDRNGWCYICDNWDGPIGLTKGYGKTNVRGRESTDENLQAKKLVYCKRIKGAQLGTENYSSSWFDNERQKELDNKRKEIVADPLDLLLKTIRN